MSKARKTRKRFIEMSKAELAAATRQFDREMVNVPGVPIPPELKARHDRVMKKRGRGRPKIGRGVRRVLITVEAGLLEAADKYADRRGMSRSALVSRGLKSVLASASMGRS